MGTLFQLVQIVVAAGGSVGKDSSSARRDCYTGDLVLASEFALMVAGFDSKYPNPREKILEIENQTSFWNSNSIRSSFVK